MFAPLTWFIGDEIERFNPAVFNYIIPGGVRQPELFKTECETTIFWHPDESGQKWKTRWKCFILAPESKMELKWKGKYLKPIEDVWSD